MGKNASGGFQRVGLNHDRVKTRLEPGDPSRNPRWALSLLRVPPIWTRGPYHTKTKDINEAGGEELQVRRCTVAAPIKGYTGLDSVRRAEMPSSNAIKK